MPNGVGYFDKALGGWLPDDPVFTCDECGCTIEEDEVEDIAGRMLCPSCLKEQYSLCSQCNRYHYTNDMTKTSKGLVCESCMEEFIDEATVL